MNETVCDEVMAKPEKNIASLFQSPQKSFVAVAAIDFGTTYSGCAFSTVQDFKTDKLRIVTIPLDDKNVFSYKTPTVLLLNPEGQFHSFGAAAEDHYVTLAESDEANSWYYFDRFKMQLYSAKDINRNMMLKEMGGKKMEAMLVFALCIEYIKDKVLDRLRLAINGLQDDDVRWVLTVPAIWSDQARQFMIKAAAKAGISKENLKLALEPEGAAMFCKYLAVDKVEHGDRSALKAFEEKAQFMVVDLGGGTIDITVSEVLPTGQLKEIYNATGGPWGGNYINGQIIKTLKEVIGWEIIRTFKLEEFYEYLELLRNVEQRKRGAKHDSELSLAISKDLSKKIKIPNSHKQSVRLSGRSIHLSALLMQKIFSSSVNTMTKHVEGLLQKKETRGVSSILLVGGYAASDFVQRAFREKFEQKYKIIFPLTPDMIVLKGAVILGHLGEAIVDRMTKYHYGLGLCAAAVSGRIISVEEDTTKTFFSLIKKGQTIKVGDVVTNYEVAIKAHSQWASIEVYTTDEDVPRTNIDEEHFTKVGNINVTLPQFKHESILILTITYCETEFKVIATDKTTGRCFVGICKFLGK
ncbi:heat shock 70 kDa protein 12A-like [Mytilus trossulus]|uniref:heat shock 70 kDa protein 12A-like n=1 Tax=Mytilus trossulus TaxID=6551 RepID=UPI0030077E8F